MKKSLIFIIFGVVCLAAVCSCGRIGRTEGWDYVVAYPAAAEEEKVDVGAPLGYSVAGNADGTFSVIVCDCEERGASLSSGGRLDYVVPLFNPVYSPACGDAASVFAYRYCFEDTRRGLWMFFNREVR